MKDRLEIAEMRMLDYYDNEQYFKEKINELEQKIKKIN